MQQTTRRLMGTTHFHHMHSSLCDSNVFLPLQTSSPESKSARSWDLTPFCFLVKITHLEDSLSCMAASSTGYAVCRWCCLVGNASTIEGLTTK